MTPEERLLWDLRRTIAQWNHDTKGTKKDTAVGRAVEELRANLDAFDDPTKKLRIVHTVEAPREGQAISFDAACICGRRHEVIIDRANLEKWEYTMLADCPDRKR